LTIPDRVTRPWPWLLGAAFIFGPLLAGCSESQQQSTGPGDTPPKESPVLTTGKDSMQEFMKNRAKAQNAPGRR